MNRIWFTVYSRGQRKLGSSAFEHIFLGEIKREEISGLHNWLFFSNEEEKKRLNYLGWMRVVDFGGVSIICSTDTVVVLITTFSMIM